MRCTGEGVPELSHRLNFHPLQGTLTRTETPVSGWAHVPLHASAYIEGVETLNSSAQCTVGHGHEGGEMMRGWIAGSAYWGARSLSDCGFNFFFVYMSRYKHKNPILFFQKTVYCFTVCCKVTVLDIITPVGLQHLDACTSPTSHYPMNPRGGQVKSRSRGNSMLPVRHGASTTVPGRNSDSKTVPPKPLRPGSDPNRLRKTIEAVTKILGKQIPWVVSCSGQPKFDNPQFRNGSREVHQLWEGKWAVSWCT